MVQHSLYYVWIRAWMEEFGPEQMLVIRAEDYYHNKYEYINAIYLFLGQGE